MYKYLFLFVAVCLLCMKNDRDTRQTSISDDNIQRAKEMVLANRRVTISKVESFLDIGDGASVLR